MALSRSMDKAPEGSKMKLGWDSEPKPLTQKDVVSPVEGKTYSLVTKNGKTTKTSY